MTLDFTGATVLVLAPHTDDGELGAGATIAKLAQQGNDVHYVAFSACETVQPDGVPADRLRHECAGATSTLGIPAANLLGETEGRGFAQLMSDLPYERALIGVVAMGAMEGAYAATRDYVHQREVFGRPAGVRSTISPCVRIHFHSAPTRCRTSVRKDSVTPVM